MVRVSQVEEGPAKSPPPDMETRGRREELRLTRCESRNTTMTVISSWKCLLTPLSIFFRSEYLISLFFAASLRAVFMSFLAIPCTLTCQSICSRKEREREGGKGQRRILHYAGKCWQCQQLLDWLSAPTSRLMQI